MKADAKTLRNQILEEVLRRSEVAASHAGERRAQRGIGATGRDAGVQQLLDIGRLDRALDLVVIVGHLQSQAVGE